MTAAPDTQQTPGSTGAGPYLPADRVVLTCLPCRIGLVLGDHHLPNPSATGVISRARGHAHRDRPASIALWRFVTDHIGDHLSVVHEGDQHLDDGTPIPADIRLIEPDSIVFTTRDGLTYTDGAPDDLVLSQYIEGWPEQPTLTHVRGPRTYTTLHPHAPFSTVDNPHQRRTIRPGIPAPATRDRPVHITDKRQAPGLTYFLAHNDDDCWVLYGLDTLGTTGYHSATIEHLDATDADAAHHWAQLHLHDDHDADHGFVTEWRPAVLEGTAGWVPLFDDTDRRLVPWNDLAPETGSRHPDAAARYHNHASLSTTPPSGNR
ncbi:hypothetical protein [Actinoplanes sp. NPDC026619]|uniref:hypothetical protein n=1 Tax=Actinoplanes sp. NPDC026619 TaxID=3155798 RepID=UPI0034026A22